MCSSGCRPAALRRRCAEAACTSTSAAGRSLPPSRRAPQWRTERLPRTPGEATPLCGRLAAFRRCETLNRRARGREAPRPADGWVQTGSRRRLRPTRSSSEPAQRRTSPTDELVGLDGRLLDAVTVKQCSATATRCSVLNSQSQGFRRNVLAAPTRHAQDVARGTKRPKRSGQATLRASVPVASASSALAPRAGRALRQDLFGAGRQQRECLIVPPGQWPLGKRPPLTLRAQFDKYSIAVQCGCALRPCALQPGCAARPWRPPTRTSTSWCS